MSLDSIFSPYKTEEDVINLLRRQIDIFGSQANFCRNFRISTGYVNDVISGKRHPEFKILKALDLEKVIYYVHSRKIAESIVKDIPSYRDKEDPTVSKYKGDWEV